MTKLIVVIGATGNQGGSVIQTYLKEPSWTVRGITRDTTSPSAKNLISQGVELVSADFDDPASWLSAFSGATAIFAMTDFWGPFKQKYAELSKISDRATGEYAMALEQKRAKTFIDAAAKVLKDEGKLEHFIWSSLPPFKELSGGKYTFNYHFDGKAAMNEYIESKQPELWKKTSILNMGFYFSNLKSSFTALSLKKQEDGTYIYTKAGSNYNAHPMVDTVADTGEFVKLLIDNKPGINLLGISQWLSYYELLKIWGLELGLKAEAREISVDEADKALPGGLGREAAESAACSAEFGWGKLTLPWELGSNVSLTPFQEYCKREDWDIITKP